MKTVRKRRKSTSRASRLADACSKIRAHIELLQVIDESEVLTEKAKMERANEILGGIDYSEVENLRDEIQDWKDNIEEKFSATQKYSDLEECASTLDSAISEIESGNEEIDDVAELEQRIGSLESGVDGCDDVSFPGMFG